MEYVKERMSLIGDDTFGDDWEEMIDTIDMTIEYLSNISILKNKRKKKK